MNDIIVLSKEIYPLKAVENTILQFKDICRTEISQDNFNYSCRFEDKHGYGLPIIMKEFENYLIDYINSEKL